MKGPTSNALTRTETAALSMSTLLRSLTQEQYLSDIGRKQVCWGWRPSIAPAKSAHLAGTQLRDTFIRLFRFRLHAQHPTGMA